MEYEGWNPGLKTDCDNLNVASYNTAIPKDDVWKDDAADFDKPACSGNQTGIYKELIVQINAYGVTANITYDQHVKYSKTYLHDYNTDWKEVNLTYEDDDIDLWLGKLKYDVLGSADGYPTNGRYEIKCVQPTGAVDGVITCP